MILSFGVGRYPVSFWELFDIFRHKLILGQPYGDPSLETVALTVRLPRIVLAVLIGGALSVSGASYQTLFKNPMVSPAILGVSAGASFGAALAMLYDAPWWQIQSSAFFFGLAAVAAAYLIAWTFGRQELTAMVLAGVIVGSLFGALLSILKLLADTESALPSIVFWLMGSLGRVSNRDVMIMAPILAISLGLLFLYRYQINALAMGEEVAVTLGVDVRVVKLLVVAAATLMTVASVTVCGVVGWIGLVVPHLSRLLAGADYPKLIAASFGLGGLILLLIDDLARGLPGAELPLGVLTSLIGAPVFVFLLTRVKKAWL
ncbi:MAG: iron ABC transporter permease [Deltaproteobacteria bacterium]|nr:iron ABC transporter permease [Deltaproteobacteria bacterium]